jgi:glycosyltransferase involved in cell wall biosynthesis
MKVLLSAFACDPTMGSEPGYGWNWAIGLAKKGYEVHCLTREIGKSNIQSVDIPKNLHFHYIKLPVGLEALYSYSQATMYLYYLLWQLFAYRKGKSLHKQSCFNLVHHVTWGSVQLGSFLYKMPVAFVFGPAGGGQFSPIAFKKYFGNNWQSEEKRKKVSNFLTKYNPAFTGMVKKATAIWICNPDTEKLVEKINSKNVYRTIDVALPTDFFPADFQPKVSQPGKLNLLWVGRFMPRKGVFLLLDVMKRLQDFPGIRLTMVGDGEDREAFSASVIENGLEERVFCQGKVAFSEVRKFYATNDVFFITSLRDSGPGQLVEAMAFGMPVVTLNLHGQSVIVNDETGFRCRCDTPEQAITALTKAILMLYNDPSLLTQMSANAYKFALSQTWNHKIEKIVTACYPCLPDTN